MQFVIRHKHNSPRRDIRHLAKVYVSCPLQYPETTNQGGNIVTEALAKGCYIEIIDHSFTKAHCYLEKVAYRVVEFPDHTKFGKGCIHILL